MKIRRVNSLLIFLIFMCHMYNRKEHFYEMY
nr:MAG TPA: hypothetical protein [Caudoviricetes sp.]